MTVDIRPFPRPDSEPLPMEGCTGVEGKVLIREDDFFVAMLRFEPGGTIHEQRDVPHPLRTEHTTMVTLMVEQS